MTALYRRCEQISPSTAVKLMVAWLLLLGLDSSLAASNYTASSQAVLSLEGVQNLTQPNAGTVELSLQATVLNEMAPLSEGGAAVAINTGVIEPAFATGPINVGIGDALRQHAAVNGSGTEASMQRSALLTEGFLDVRNDSTTDTFVLQLKLTYSVTGLATVGDPFVEDAFSTASVTVHDALNQLQYPSGVTTSDGVFAASVIADGLFGLTQDTTANELLMTLDIAPGTVNVIRVFADADGRAGSFVAARAYTATGDDDGDGIANTADNCRLLSSSEQIDTDSDGLGNPCDVDDDNDGTPDRSDAFPVDSTEVVDTDGDGVGNNADSDDDNDTTPDIADAFPLDATESVDTDGDGVGNNADVDDDNDGISDTTEISQGRNPLLNESTAILPIIQAILD